MAEENQALVIDWILPECWRGHSDWN